ncbi:MAG: hypothetical protein ABUK01_11960 [Leptospirales bacterium]
MWCIPKELSAEYIKRMEDILDLYAKPLNPKEPVICLDEKPIQLHGEVREPIQAKSGSLIGARMVTLAE